MNVAVDFEFWNAGHHGPLVPISVAAVADNGREFYGEFDDVDRTWVAEQDPWVAANVLDRLTGPILSVDEIIRGLVDVAGPNPRFWGWMSGFDYALLSRLFGPFSSGRWPAGWPYHINDVAQILHLQALPAPADGSAQHHALDDARWVLRAVQALPATPVPICVAVPGRQSHHVAEHGPELVTRQPVSPEESS